MHKERETTNQPKDQPKKNLLCFPPSNNKWPCISILIHFLLSCHSQLYFHIKLLVLNNPQCSRTNLGSQLWWSGVSKQVTPFQTIMSLILLCQTPSPSCLTFSNNRYYTHLINSILQTMERWETYGVGSDVNRGHVGTTDIDGRQAIIVDVLILTTVSSLWQ